MVVPGRRRNVDVLRSGLDAESPHHAAIARLDVIDLCLVLGREFPVDEFAENTCALSVHKP